MDIAYRFSRLACAAPRKKTDNTLMEVYGSDSQDDCRYRTSRGSYLDRITWARTGTLGFPQHVDREAFSVDLAICVRPKAIRLIALDSANGHQRPSRT